MQWLQVTIDAPNGDIDIVSARLEDFDIRDLVIEDEATFHSFLQNNQRYWDYVDEDLLDSMAGKSRVIFYLEDSPESESQLETVKDALPWSIAVETIQEEDWANNWKRYFKPLPIGRQFLVVPQWEANTDPKGRIPLFLDPGLIFGTGAHPTTKRSLELVEYFTRPGQMVLDLGCGSGILSIAALLLGAAQATACDIDPKAPDIVRANAKLNGLDNSKITPLHGDILAPGPLRQRLANTQYDLILANIVADVIIALSAFTAPWLKEECHLICSGILDGRESEVKKALSAGGFSIMQRHQDGDWHSFVCTVSKNGKK